jgi:Flp pilus assembly protein TadB
VTPLVPALSVGCLVAAIGAVGRPRPGRHPGPPVLDPHGPGGGPVDRLTRAVLRRLRLPAEEVDARRRARWALGLGLLVAPLGPPLALLPATALWLGARRRSHVRRRSARRALERALPEVVDLLALCTSAGLTLPLAHPLLAEAVGPPLGPALAAAHRAAELGRSRADALAEALKPLGDGPTALAHVLADHLRYGTPLGPSLDRLGMEVRLHRRRRAEEDARRVPIRLLGPLVACVLPAFGLLTVVPLLAASLRALPT